MTNKASYDLQYVSSEKVERVLTFKNVLQFLDCKCECGSSMK